MATLTLPGGETVWYKRTGSGEQPEQVATLIKAFIRSATPK